jgi:hypothetical protein
MFIMKVQAVLSAASVNPRMKGCQPGRKRLQLVAILGNNWRLFVMPRTRGDMDLVKVCEHPRCEPLITRIERRYRFCVSCQAIGFPCCPLFARIRDHGYDVHGCRVSALFLVTARAFL